MSNPRPAWFRRLVLTGLAAAAALVLIVVIAGPLRRTDGPNGDVPRAVGLLPIAIVKPIADAPFDRTFSWRPVDGASSYSVAVFRGDGERSFEVRDVKGAGVALSPTVKLAPGPYFWQVVAVRNGETIAESPRTPFLIPDP